MDFILTKYKRRNEIYICLSKFTQSNYIIDFLLIIRSFDNYQLAVYVNVRVSQVTMYYYEKIYSHNSFFVTNHTSYDIRRADGINISVTYF